MREITNIEFLKELQEETKTEFVNWLAIHFMFVVMFFMLMGGVYIWLW